jgi:formamidopyrimidine-DNA glycosylase
MPELPEVETICNGIRPFIQHKTLTNIIVRESQLRWKIPNDFAQTLLGLSVKTVTRRGKYCLVNTDAGSILLHFGMSGSLRIVDAKTLVTRHDHVDFIFDDQTILRFNDPRKFGAVLWAEGNALEHRLLKNLGPEPLSTHFNGELLHQRALKRRKAIKPFIMDGHIVVGVGNIYASESLFSAGIHPERAAGTLSLVESQRLATVIKTVLQQAIHQGGTTLKDFVNVEGKPGYFSQKLQVYGRTKQACFICQTPIEHIIQAQRASYFCPSCQC